MATDKQTLYQGFMLAQWKVEPLRGQIKAPDGARRHVTPKAMDVLVCLARRPGDTVERLAIFNEVWGQLHHSDEALTHCVSELRRALDDKPERPTFLQTVPKRGYRLVAPVSAISATPQPTTSSDHDKPVGLFARQFQDLRKRKVFQAVAGYPVLAWLLLQIVDFLFEYLLLPLDAPTWLVPAFVVLLALGYPVVIFLVWAVDLTPEGLQLTTSDPGSPPATGLVVLGLGSISLTALALFLYFNAYETPQVTTLRDGTIAASPVENSIAVLRFLNISDDPAINYLCDGLTEELIHELTNLGKIKVAARTAIWPFSTSELQKSDVAGKLKVEKLLEGSIRKDGEQIRVTAQLIDDSGFHLWSESYDREFRRYSRHTKRHCYPGRRRIGRLADGRLRSPIGGAAHLDFVCI